MSKAIFAFVMGAIVTMPGLNGTRGKIRSRYEHDDVQPDYFVEALAGSSRRTIAVFTQSSLIAANPPEVVPVAPTAKPARSSKRKR